MKRCSLIDFVLVWLTCVWFGLIWALAEVWFGMVVSGLVNVDVIWLSFIWFSQSTNKQILYNSIYEIVKFDPTKKLQTDLSIELLHSTTKSLTWLITISVSASNTVLN